MGNTTLSERCQFYEIPYEFISSGLSETYAPRNFRFAYVEHSLPQAKVRIVGLSTFRKWNSGRGFKGAEIETPYREWGSWLALWTPPAGSGVEPRPKTNLGHIERRRTPVVEGKSGISWDIYNGLHKTQKSCVSDWFQKWQRYKRCNSSIASSEWKKFGI